MLYLSLCSGIEAATVAWEPLGWIPAAYAEIEKFPSALLAHHYPNIPNLGDITQISGKDFCGKIDLIVGGSPCQAFSTAGLRKGMDDPRGQLTLVFLKIIGKARPRWVLWENVPGVLSIDGGRTFGSIIGQMAKFGYGFAWRVLDAQYFGIPQRRRRVFLIGYLGNWRPAAAVLFERHCLSGDTAPRRKTGQEVAGTFTSRSRSGGWSQDVDLAAGGYMRAVPPLAGTITTRTGRGGALNDEVDNGRIIPSLTAGAPFSKTGNSRTECEALVFGGGNTSGPIKTSPNLNAHGSGSRRMDFASEALIATPIQEVGKRTGKSTSDPRAGLGIGSPGDPMFTMQAGAQHGVFIASTLRGEGFDASEDGTGRANLIPINLQLATRHNALGDKTSLGIGREGDPAFTLTKTHSHGIFTDAQGLSLRGRGAELSGDISTALRAAVGGSSKAHVLSNLAVRRLSVRECERLQGFEDDYTLIPWRGKPAEHCPDGPRYKALGNSMAVPVMRWIGERINLVESIMADKAV